MDVNIEWDVDVEKKSDSIALKYVFDKIHGSFTVTHSREEFYTKQSVYNFKIAGTSVWKISHVPFQTDEISPTGAIINFDEKTINIKF
jgi:hypothetical protein